MNLEKFALFSRHIIAMHSEINESHGKVVKYITPTLDVRSGEVFAITFTGFGWSSRVLRSLDRDFYQDCMDDLHKPTTVIVDGTASSEVAAIMNQPKVFWSNNVAG